ncbi:hypothetical protein BDP27DRAFT_1446268, partial [Rhodocollybia butyracea]
MHFLPMYSLTLALHILLATAVSAFKITIEQNPPIFAPVSLAGGVLNKVLSLQVNGTSSLNGTLNTVFILVGPHIIQAIDGNSADSAVFFNSTVLNAVDATSSGTSTSSGSSSCTTSTTPTVTVTETNSSSKNTNSSIVIGATLGTILPLTILGAVLA